MTRLHADDQRTDHVRPTHIRVAQASDLILLKLYAGGSQDRWDIEQLLAGPGPWRSPPGLGNPGRARHTVFTMKAMKGMKAIKGSG